MDHYVQSPWSQILYTAVGFFALSVCASACGSDSEMSQTADWTVRDSAGVTLVSNHTDGLSRGCVTVSPDPETTIPSSAASPPLYRVQGGVLLDDGRIVVLNAGNKELLFFGADGRFQRGVGRSGRGPGEFVDPRWLGQGDNDTLFVWDGGLMRLSTFDGAGELLALHQVRVGDVEGKLIAIRGRFDDGSFFFSPGPLVFFDGTAGILRFPETYGRYNLETRQAEHLVEGAGSETVAGSDVPVYELPFGKMDVAIANGDAVVIGDNGTSILRYYDLAGQLRRVVEWVSLPITIKDRDKTAYHRYRARLGPRWRLPPTARFADERPRFSSIQSDLMGWLWVRSYTAGWESSGHWLVFDEEGVLRCSVDPPARRFRPLQISETHILGVQRNEDGEETVVLHSLVRNM